MFNNNVMRMLLMAEGDIAPDWYFPVRLVILIAIIILAIFITLVVLMQKTDPEGMGAITGAVSDSYLGKNKGKSWEGKLKKLTVIAAALIIVLSITFAVLGATV